MPTPTTVELERILKPWFSSDERRVLIRLIVETLTEVVVVPDELDDLDDVDTSGAVEGSALVYDGASWIATLNPVYDPDADGVSAPGANGEVVYNDGGILASAPNLTFDAAGTSLTLLGAD